MADILVLWLIYHIYSISFFLNLVKPLIKLGLNSPRFNPDFPYDWTSGTVKKILENRVYLGETVNNKECQKSFKLKKRIINPPSEWIIVKGTHEPIIDEDTFNKVGELIKVKQRKNQTKLPNLFAGIVKCALPD